MNNESQEHKDDSLAKRQRQLSMIQGTVMAILSGPRFMKRFRGLTGDVDCHISSAVENDPNEGIQIITSNILVPLFRENGELLIFRMTTKFIPTMDIDGNVSLYKRDLEIGLQTIFMWAKRFKRGYIDKATYDDGSLIEPTADSLDIFRSERLGID